MDGLVDADIEEESGLPVGPVIPSAPSLFPERVVLEGRYCRLEPLEARHAAELFEVSTPPDAKARFRYLFDEVPTSVDDTEKWIARKHANVEFAVIVQGRVEGRVSLMRIDVANQSVEIGNVYFGPRLARTRAATEVNFLLASYVFDDRGFRRYEWKCDALNAKSRNAALRFGFRYEGLFRRHYIIKGRRRDTTWFAMLFDDWPDIKDKYEKWLNPANFDANGAQIRKLH